MIRTSKGVWAMALVGSAAALSGCPNNGGGGGGGDIAIADLPNAIGAAYCGVASRCGFTSALEQGLLHEAITNCNAQFASYFSDVAIGQYQEAIANGTIVYHADRARACIDQFGSTSCGGFASMGSSTCTDVFEGTVADGQPCDIGEQCVSNYCDTSAGTTCPRGTCRQLATQGATCNGGSDCATGLYCAMASGASSGMCTPEIASGGACDVTMNARCAGGLSCVTAMGSTMGTCGTPMPAAEGQPCTSGLCDTGLVCAYGGMGAPTCRRPRTDGTCQVSFGAVTDCPSGQTCNASFSSPNGMCVSYPTVGMPCTNVCSGSVCVTSGSTGMGTCTAVHHNGESCTMDTDCFSNHCASGSCAAPPLCAM